MSMRDYGVNDYGLLLTEETMEHLASVMCEDYTEDEYKYDRFSFNDDVVNKLCEYISSFSGEAIKIRDNGDDDWMSQNCAEYYNDDVIYYIPLYRYPSLFSAAYADINEIVDEMKGRAGAYLPSDFDYRGNLRHIIGTYYG